VEVCLDVVVIGGGPAGCAAGIRLARAGCQVAIIDRARSGSLCVGETLPPQASQVLSELGLRDPFLAQKHRPSPGVVSAWGRAEPAVTDFLFSPHGSGWHIDRVAFNQLLIRAAIDSGTKYYSEATALVCIRSHSRWHIRTSSGATFTSAILIDAAGRGTCGISGFPARTVQDHLISVAGIAAPRQTNDFTLIEATEAGWFYSALLPSGKFIITFTTDADLYAVGRSRNHTYLDEQLNRAPLTRERIGVFPQHFRLLSAASIFRTHTALPGWLATGDAAQSFDPLSGLGLVHSMSLASSVTTAALDQLDGRLDSSYGYEAANRATFAKYSRFRIAYYSLERRWPESPFWKRRQISAKPVPPG
jgi:flavin-dependent dehydrogenase